MNVAERVVVDTGPLLDGFRAPPDTDCYVVEGVLRELERHGVQEAELTGMALRTGAADQAARAAVASAAAASGDAGVLSDVDVELLALALAERAPLVTDDYAIQNVASGLGIETRSFQQRPIREVRRWVWVCKACSSYRGERAGECPVCGATLRRMPS